MNIVQDLTNVNINPDGMKQVRGIVLHSMWGTLSGTVAWFKNPQSQASAHFNIGKDGKIIQTVREQDRAWHAGKFDEGKCPAWASPNPNWYCIGIELEDEKNADWGYPEAQRDATYELVEYLMRKYNIARDHVLLHKDLNPSRRSDPVGHFSFDWVFNDDTHAKNLTKMLGADYIRDNQGENFSPKLDIANTQWGRIVVNRIETLRDHLSKTQKALEERDGELDTARQETNKALSAVCPDPSAHAPQSGGSNTGGSNNAGHSGSGSNDNSGSDNPPDNGSPLPPNALQSAIADLIAKILQFVDKIKPRKGV